MAETGDHEYLTTRELADLLRVRERKVYELAAAGEVPCSRATGKLLFRRVAIDAWLARSSSGPIAPAAPTRASVIGGSHDPLLEWALRESEAGLATLFEGSLDGLERFADGQLLASALHVPLVSAPAIENDPGEANRMSGGAGRASADGSADGTADGAFEWNVPLVRERFAAAPVALVAFARRTRGLIVPAGNEDRVRGIGDLGGRRVVPRQAGAGSQVLFELLVARASSTTDALELVPPTRSEGDAALAVAEGRGDVAFGLEGPARQLGLGFVPIATERFDLLVDRRAWFEPPLQRLAAFCRTAAFREKARTLGGYDVERFGEVRFNGA